MTGIDLNRAGTPLLEIVSEPDMRSSDEAVAYAKTLHALVRWIGICDGNMQEGSFRCDANVSVRRDGQRKLGTRCEIKNLNSFRFMQEAIEFEVRRQIELIEDGGSVVQETRLYDPDATRRVRCAARKTRRTTAIFPIPTCRRWSSTEDWIARVRADMPELPEAMKERFAEQYLLYPEDSAALTTTLATAGYFTRTMQALAQVPGVPYASQGHDATNGKSVANWVINELGALLNNHQVDIADAPVSPKHLAELIAHTDRFKGTVSHKVAKEVLAAMWAGEQGGDPGAIIAAKGLAQISDEGAVGAIVDDVIATHPAIVAEVKAGKEKAFNSLVGQVMKMSKGKANPAQVNAILKRKLG